MGFKSRGRGNAQGTSTGWWRGRGATNDRPMQIKFKRVFFFFCLSFRSNEANGCHGTAIAKFQPISFKFGFDERRMRSLKYLFNMYNNCVKRQTTAQS